jgi:CRP-like cAMP-binding protein
MGQVSEVREYGDGEAVCLQGQKADRLYILRQGRLGVYINADLDAPGIREVLREGIHVGTIEGDGTVAAEGGLFLERRISSLVAQGERTCVEHIQVTAKGLQKVMVKRPALAMSLCRSFAWQLRDLSSRLRDAVHVIEAVNRERARFSLDYLQIMREIRTRGHDIPELNLVFKALESNALYIQGRELQESREQTAVIFRQAASQQRSGTLNLHTGQILCEEGRMGRQIYFVHRGLLEVLIGTHRVGYIGPEEIVGEVAVLLKEAPRRTATVQAVKPSTVSAIPMIEFHKLAEERPSLLVHIARMLSERLDAAHKILCSETRSTDRLFDLIAGAEGSCENHFRELAGMLEEFPSATTIATKARQAAVRAARLRAELEERHGNPAGEAENAAAYF